MVPERDDLSGVSAASVPLRDGAALHVIRSGRAAPAAIALKDDGSYLYVGLAGAAALRHSGRAEALTSGCLHLLRPGREGARHIEAASPATLAILAYFSPRWCGACPHGPGCKVARFLLGRGVGPCGDQRLDLDPRGRTLARRLLDAHLDDDGDLLSVERDMLALLSWTYATSENPLGERKPRSSLHPQAASKVRRAADILRQRLDDPPTIPQLSAAVGLNESDLKRCFKCLYGESVAAYSRRKRLDAARDLLAHSPLGVAAIALEVGYANPSQFARAFRQEFGRNPADYRRAP